LFISAEVVRELAAPSFPNRSKAMEMIRQTSVLALSDDVIDFAEILVNEKVMPGPATEGDALHVAAATIHGVEYVLTWNVRHLANPKKRTHFGIICMRLGLVAPMLITADLLQEADDE
jgi:hypothetical protein